MELTVGLFAELVKSLRAQGTEGPAKGQPPRVGLRLRASVVGTKDGDQPVSVWVRDVSAVGVGILCPQPFQPGDTLRLLLAGDGPNSVGCTVAGCHPVAAGLYGVEAEFGAKPSA